MPDVGDHSQPPNGRSFSPLIFVVLLAAGRSNRMGMIGASKLLAEFDGIALVRRSAQVALGSTTDTVVVITGHRRLEIEAALGGLEVECVENPLYESGMATSLATGVSHCRAQGADAILVMLADMPGLTSGNLDQLIAAFRSTDGDVVVRAMGDGKQGNPVILPKTLFEAVEQLEGDVGARQVIEASGLPVVYVEIGQAALLDVDTPEAVRAAGGTLNA
ncbi:nucleotidyltransferase family protein [Agrobacterium sp. CNPSo 2736]|uniref:nucleotidyltransferase family protein n=1 Tax=Agrobacterium sp. CNPSo 2736 TaxID=2499627 RepID=UPI000FDCA7E8|nr:nucleotidyltransferase family protein [Agrobacterium sp. CNPSo 2736]RVT74227.1 nucleotidyltransferase family protein [Agrobacterium sp. CNPSo 2736]